MKESGSLKVRVGILARRSTLLGLLVILAGSAGCARRSEDPAKVRSRVQHYLRSSLEEEGGKAAVARLASYRAEGIVTLIPERKVVHVTRMVDATGRMRTEVREKDRGGVRIVSETGAWSGPDDRSLAFTEPSLLDILTLAAARRDFPLPFAGRDSLDLRPPDKKKRIVLRARSANGILIDYHLDKKNRLCALSVRAEEEPDLVYHVELGAFRRVHGARFPFRESITKDNERLAEVAFRDVEPSPELPASLFVPRVPTPPDTSVHAN
jgi:hypothetical protein